MKSAAFYFCTALFFASGCTASPDSSPALRQIGPDELCATNGAISERSDGHLAIDTPSSRAVLRVPSAQTAEIRFRYLGPSAGSKPLASGEMRRQIGLKLRAQDSCNLVYAMWHIEPDSKIAVSVKHNADKHTHAQCGAKGYTFIKARTGADVPRVTPGQLHTLRAELHGDELTVVADGKTVWNGSLGSVVASINGPVGLRTDNARFAFNYYAADVLPRADSGKPKAIPSPCVASPGD